MQFTVWYIGEYGLGRLEKKAKNLDALMQKLPKYVKKGLQWVSDSDDNIIWETE